MKAAWMNWGEMDSGSPHHTGSRHVAAAGVELPAGAVGWPHDATSSTSAIDRATHMPSQRTDGANRYEAMHNFCSGGPTSLWWLQSTTGRTSIDERERNRLA